MVKRPNSRTNLDKAIQRLYGEREKFVNMRSLVANVIVGQFLLDAVAKGGSALKLRYGDIATRVTTDFDIAFKSDVEAVVDALSAGLAAGWNGFTGTVVKERPATPRNIDPAYVMKPYSVKLQYLHSPWCTVDLEVGFNELGDADAAEFELSDEVLEVFRSLGFPDPKPVPLMSLEYQIAQKLHGATTPGGSRAHDLIDLQIVINRFKPDYLKLHRLCRRLFAYRKRQPWPTKITGGSDWAAIYDQERGDLEVLQSVNEAIDWANALITMIDETNG